jgi:hypothetical protein
MSLLTQDSANEFSSARQQAFLEEWINFFTGRPNDLLSFEEVRQNLRLQNVSYKGLQSIELDKIVGSVGRYQDFTRKFLPRSNNIEERWRRVDAVAHDQGFPPIDVYKVGDVYFVRDGNHRVSVARAHKAETIEAYIIECKTTVPVEKDDDLDDILLKQEQTEFLEQTQLDQLRPDHQIVFTEPGRYRLLLEHIAFHKYLRETELGREISYEEAVTSWYDNVYMPVIVQILRSGALKEFPDRTEADLYTWLLLHRAAFENELRALGHVPTTDLLETLKRERATNPFARLMGLFRNQQNLQSLSLRVERDKFLEETRLDELRPNNSVRFSEAGCYNLARQHIDVHKYLKESELGHEISNEDAVCSWFDQVYTPVVHLIKERQVLKSYPKNTAGDLYIWIVSRRKMLEEQFHAMGQIPTEKVIAELELEISARPMISRLTQLFGGKIDLDSALDSGD